MDWFNVIRWACIIFFGLPLAAVLLFMLHEIFTTVITPPGPNVPPMTYRAAPPPPRKPIPTGQEKKTATVPSASVRLLARPRRKRIFCGTAVTIGRCDLLILFTATEITHENRALLEKTIKEQTGKHVMILGPEWSHVLCL